VNAERRFVAGIECSIAEPQGAGKTTPTIICLHGIGGDDASFQPQLDQLSEFYRVVSWNMPGYRQSTPLPVVTFEALAAKVQSVIEALDYGPVHVMGQSIGGMIAQEVFHRAPATVRSLILVATTTAFGGRDESFKKTFLAQRLKPLDDGSTMAEMARDAIPAIVADEADDAVIHSAIDSMAKLNSDVYREVLNCLVTFNRRDEWSDITCPVLLVAGSEDTNSPASTMKKMADKLAHAEYHVLANAGHLVNLEKGDQFNQVTLKFLHRH